MSVVACLGWGSLVWDPRELPIHRRWHNDGPFVPVEFARPSSDGRITLVVVDAAKSAPVRTLWAAMDVQDLDAAREALRLREEIPKDKPEDIGCWDTGETAPAAIPGIADWTRAHGIRAVVWTALPPKFNNEKRLASEDEIVDYLRSRRGRERDNSERYIRMAPRQIDTAYRRRIEAELGWTALDRMPD